LHRERSGRTTLATNTLPSRFFGLRCGIPFFPLFFPTKLAPFWHLAPLPTKHNPPPSEQYHSNPLTLLLEVGRAKNSMPFRLLMFRLTFKGNSNKPRNLKRPGPLPELPRPRSDSAKLTTRHPLCQVASSRQCWDAPRSVARVLSAGSHGGADGASIDQLLKLRARL
jgi:hypothetical protein